jgi:hypothetical protein
VEITLTLTDDDVALLSTQGSDLPGIALGALRQNVFPAWASLRKQIEDKRILDTFYALPADVQQQMRDIAAQALGGG